MKKITGLLLAAVILISCFQNVTAASYVTLRSGTYATVIEVVDGDAIVVQTDDGKAALVRLIGVDVAGYDGAYEFMVRELMGTRVYLTLDSAVPSPVDRWNKMYVYRNNVLMNARLLTNGLAKTNKDDANAIQYKALVTEETSAMYAKIGVWNESGLSGAYVYGGERVNINTASLEQLKTLMQVSNYSLASAITAYRDRHPFETVSELKFVRGMTRDIYNDIYFKCSVSTNINTASVEELQRLKSVTNTMAQEIADYRARYRLDNLQKLVDEKIITSYILNANLPFISLTDVERITYAVPNYTVNLNTATQAQLQLAGLSSLQTGRILSGRVSGYMLKSLGEIASFDRSYYDEMTINYLADNLHIHTDLNFASEDELRSLLGDGIYGDVISRIVSNRPYSTVDSLKSYISADYYNRLSPYLYVDTSYGEYVNANTATYDQLRDAGLSSYQADLLFRNRGNMLNAGSVPRDAISGSDKFSLITNVNTASALELESLSTGMTSGIISDILYYRSSQPFGSLAEFKELFDRAGKLSVYNELEKFVSVR